MLNIKNDYVVDESDISMKHTNLLAVLKELGLSEHEAGVYLAALALGPTTILRIAQAAEIKRTTVYSVMDSLKQKGLVSIAIKGLKKLYVPENPEKLESILESRRAKLQILLPEFVSLYNLKGGGSFIKYYEGREGIKTVYENLLRDLAPHDFYLVVSDMKQWYSLDEQYFQDFIERRAKIPLDIRALFQASPIASKLQQSKPIYKADVKILPSQTALTTNLVVTPGKVIIHQLTHPVQAIVIENKSVIQMHKEMFEIMWSSISI